MTTIPPQILERVIKDVMHRCSCQREECRVVAIQAVTWRDGSLGCPEPGRNYTQALVRGYRAVFEVQGKQLDYRISERGYYRLCTVSGLSGHLPIDAI